MQQATSESDFQQLVGQPVLVTGATGFIGGHLVRRLIAVGAKVRILARRGSSEDEVVALQSLGAEIFYGDVTDRESVYQAVRGSEFIFHLAALINDFTAPDKLYYEVNVEGTRNVLAAAEEYGAKRVVHCSTIGVHSSITNLPANENEPCRPSNIYQTTKCEAEKVAKEYMARARVEVVVIRPAHVWGEGDARALKLFRGVKRRVFPRIGTGQTLTHFVYVHDLVASLLLAAVKDQANGQTYIIAGKRAVSINELIETIAVKAGAGSPLFSLPAKPLQILGVVTETVCKPFKVAPPIYSSRVRFFTESQSFDTRKAQAELGFQPQQGFEQEVSKIFDWYKENGLL